MASRAAMSLFCILLGLFAIFRVHSQSEVNFYSGKFSYAIFEKVDLRHEAVISFRFKTTTNKFCVLLYAGSATPDVNSFVTLLMDRGQLIVRVQTLRSDQENLKVKRIPLTVNDYQWHRVTLTRNYRATSVTVDDLTRVVTNEGITSQIDVVAKVYMAGIPRELDAGILNDDTRDEASFLGCIDGVVSGPDANSLLPLRLLSRRDWGLSSACSSICQFYCSADRPCAEIKERQSECPCFERETKSQCQIADVDDSNVMPLSFEGFSYVTRLLEKTVQSQTSWALSFVFKTNSPFGVMVTIGKEGDYVTIEMYDGEIRLEMDFGMGPLSVIGGGGKLHDGSWHSVWARRSGREVSLSVDGSFVGSSTVNQPVVMGCQSGDLDLLYVGGHFRPSSVLGSHAGANFVGCLKQLQLNRVPVLDNVYSMKKYGNVTTECRVERNRIPGPGKPSLPNASSPHGQSTSSPATKAISVGEQKLPETRLSSNSTIWIVVAILAGIGILVAIAMGTWCHFRRQRQGTFFVGRRGSRGAYNVARKPIRARDLNGELV